MRLTKQCYGCKQQFRYEELTDYAAPMAKTMHSYCINCLREKQLRDKFSDTVCMIFGIKSPGPRIWTERKRLIKEFGYTDDVIIDCLNYLYNVRKVKKLSESLALVNPYSVERMRKWKASEEYKNNMIAKAAQETQIADYFVPVKENTTTNKKILNADDFLEEE